MLAQDRRQYKRNRRLVTATLRFGNAQSEAVSLDVSAGGGYFFSNVAPPPGTNVILEIKDNSSSNHTIQLCSRVVRGDVNPAKVGRNHGFGVRWVQFTSSIGEVESRRTLEKVFGVERMDAGFRNPPVAVNHTSTGFETTRDANLEQSSATTPLSDVRNRTESPFAVRRSVSETQPTPPISRTVDKPQLSRAGSETTGTTHARPVQNEVQPTLNTSSNISSPQRHDSRVTTITTTGVPKQETRVLTVPPASASKPESRIFAAPATSLAAVSVTSVDSEEFGFGAYNGVVVTTPLPYVSWNCNVFRIGAPVRIVSGEQVAIGRVESSDSPERIHVVLEGKPLRAGSELSIAAPAKVRGKVCAHEVRAQVVESTIGESPSVTLACLAA